MKSNPIAALTAFALLAAAPSLAATTQTMTLATTPATSPAVRNALAATDLAGAQKLIGKPGAFQGTLTKVYSPGDHDVIILDFAADYKSALTAVVLKNNVGKFGDLSAAQGKHLLVSGTFSMYKSRPEIILTHPNQITLIR